MSYFVGKQYSYKNPALNLGFTKPGAVTGKFYEIFRFAQDGTKVSHYLLFFFTIYPIDIPSFLPQSVTQRLFA
jgi:hypothetical protein